MMLGGGDGFLASHCGVFFCSKNGSTRNKQLFMSLEPTDLPALLVRMEPSDLPALLVEIELSDLTSSSGSKVAIRFTSSAGKNGAIRFNRSDLVGLCAGLLRADGGTCGDVLCAGGCFMAFCAGLLHADGGLLCTELFALDLRTDEPAKNRELSNNAESIVHT